MPTETFSQINIFGIEQDALIGLAGEVGVSLELFPKSDVRMSAFAYHETYSKSVSRILSTIPSGYSVTFEAMVVNGQEKVEEAIESGINPIVQEILMEKKEQFSRHSKTIKYYAHIWKSTVDPLREPIFPSFLSSIKKQINGRRTALDNFQDIIGVKSSFCSALSSINVKTNELTESGLKNHLWEKLSPKKSEFLQFEENNKYSLRSQLVPSNTKESDKNFYLDGNYHAYVSIYTYPDELSHGAIDSLIETLPVGSSYYLNVTVPDQEKYLDDLKIRHKTAGSLAQESARKDFESGARYGDLDEIITRCRNEGERVYSSWAGIMLRHEDEKILENWKKDLLFSIKEIFHGSGLDEDCLHKVCFLSTLPFNAHLNPRRYIFLGSSLSGLTPLSHPWSGTGKGALVMTSHNKENIAIDIYDGGSPRHGIIVASTGSGKSFTANVLVMGLLSDPDARVMIIDIGGSYRRITEILGGTYFDIKIDERYAINPLLPKSSMLDENGKIDGDMLASQTSLIARIAKVDSGPGRLILEKAIERIYQSLEDPLLSDLYKVLKNNPWEDSLKDHVPKITNELMPYIEGVYSKIFSSETKIRPFEKQLTVFDLAGLKDHKDLQSALIGVIAFSLNRKLSDKRIKKLIIVDEGWDLFSDPAAADLISRLYRQARKQNAAIFSISQSPAEFLSSPVSAAIMANIYWVMALKMSTGHDQLLKFGFSDQAVERASSLQMVSRSFSEVLLRFGDAPNRIARISPTSLQYWIATTNAEETFRESDNRAKNNLSALDSIKQMAAKEPVTPW